MNIQDWWPLLDSSTQQWLIENNGDVVPPDIMDQITVIAGQPTADDSWIHDAGRDGLSLSDEAIDWIEQTANDESSARG
ncbi:hypothetical protein [Arthrobacter polaris]|uniref:hypothetical protein n=1 Tax=Arthrobacter polaris TaxID=2813727 RepID=UPI001F20CC07|nr:hypothetical protein [Arthrobacter polaris]UIK89953.1 hypothetical protein J0916_06425 [Arthrobacter polaris]